MPCASLASLIKQELQEFRGFLAGCDYQESTIISYNKYVSKFLHSNHYNKREPGLEKQIDKFLQDVFKKRQNHSNIVVQHYTLILNSGQILHIIGL